MVAAAFLLFLITLQPARAQDANATPTPAATPAPTPTPAATPTADQKKKISDAENAVTASRAAINNAESARRRASGHVGQLKNLSAFRAADDAAVRDMEDLSVVVADVAAADFLAAPTMHASLKSLAKVKDDLQKARDALPAEGEQPEGIATARRAAVEALERVEAQEKSVTETRGQLEKAVKGVYDNSLRLAELLEKQLGPVVNLAQTASPTGGDVRKVLVRHLTSFQQVERLSREMSEEWEALKVALDKVKPADAAPQQVTDKFAAVRTQVATVPPKLKVWLVALKDDSERLAGEVGTLRNEVRKDPQKNNGAGIEKQRETSPVLDDLRAIDAAWVSLEAQLKGVDYTGYDPLEASVAARNLRSGTVNLGGALADLRDALAGDFSDFVGDQVSLFYFSDVPRLMQILNPDTREEGGIRGAADEAARERRALTSAELELADAQSVVNRYQVRLETLREELRQANASADAASNIFKKTAQALAGAQRDKTRADERFEKADTEAKAAPDDLQKRETFDRVAAERDRATARVEESQRRNTQADEDRKAATERQDALRDEQNGLPAQIADAQSKLEIAQAAVNRQRKSALLAAQAESEAFVKARDNRPFWYAPANAASTDPAKHVIMWAFNDSKTIFLRGKPDDIAAVKCLIAKIDKPSPQARMTLWTMELSSDASIDGTRKFNKALEIVEDQLSNTRALNAAALSLFRDLINKTVNNVATRELATQRKVPSSADDYRLARLAFYPDEVLYRLGFNPRYHFDKSVNDPQLVRLTIPDPAGTTTLGEALMVLNLGKKEHRISIVNDFARSLPGYLAGLGLENLPGRLSRLSSWDDDDDDRPPLRSWFPLLRRALNLDEAAVQSSDGGGLSGAQEESLRALGLNAAQITEIRSAPTRAEQGARAARHNLTDAQINAVFSGYSSGAGGLSAAQVEILHAIEQVAYERMFDYTLDLRLRLADKERQLRTRRKDLFNNAQEDEVNRLPRCVSPESLKRMEEQSRTFQQIQEDERRKTVQQRGGQMPSAANAEPPRPPTRALTDGGLFQESGQLELRAIEEEYCTLSNRFLMAVGKMGKTSGVSPDWFEGVVRARQAAAEERGRAAQLRLNRDEAGARVAEARVREHEDTARAEESKLRNRGTRQNCASPLRTANAREAAADQMLKDMIIAVEDDLARLFVQPMLSDLREKLRSKTGIGVGILQRTSVLATNRLLARVDPRASAQLPLGEQTDVLGAAQQLAQIFFAAQAAGPLGALGALQALPRKPQAELYGLTTGNVFQVTPIFDPSGQALRFKFDHVGASQIREPDGTVNPQLPRIERHTVNTEVQISNLELREISRFESNARLGIANRYTGGLPIFKDIPYVRRIPLIGWFVRTGGRNAVTQQSLIFGQTTMYPTIGDIMDLLTTTVDVSTGN